ncbi:MAG: CRISPR-associated endonuclease Cas1 [Verrucomicrobiota bacterium]
MPTACILQRGASVRLHSERIEIWAPPEEGGTLSRIRDVPIHDVERLILREGSHISTEALCALLRADIPISLLGWNDRFAGGFLPPTNHHGLWRLRQYEKTMSPDFALNIAKRLVLAKIANQRRVLQRLSANRAQQMPEEMRFLQNMRDLAVRTENLDELRGYEGAAAARYFQAWATFLPVDFPFERRSTRPPHNAVNACISFGATILYNESVAAIHAHGLDPALGILHATENGRWSLALDLIEPFRPVLVEALALDLFTHKMVDRTCFEPHQGGIYLSERGRRIFVLQYERRMDRQFMSEHAGHRTTIRDQLFDMAAQYKSAIENPDYFLPFEMN